VGAIFHKDVTFILKPEIPEMAWPFMDNCGIKGPATCYEMGDGGFETIQDNDQVHRFIWEHLNNVHCILHYLRCTSTTVSTKRLFIAIPKVVILGHKCNYEGCILDDSKTVKVCNWPECQNVSDVHTFLGLASYMRIWIKNYSSITHPLVNLTCKGIPFTWQEEHKQAVQTLKDKITQSTALISINYSSDHTIYLLVDSSIQGIGWILTQDCPDGCHCPSHFGSI